MTRVLGVLALALLVAGTTRGDGLPPKGQKRVTLDNKITTEKDFPDYDFYTSVGGGKRGPTVTAVKLDPKTPIVISGSGRSAGIGRQGSLYAVPQGAAAKYDSEQAFFTALTGGKVEGQIRAKTNFDAITTIKDDDTRTTVVYEWKVEKLDKDGFVLKFPDRGDPKVTPPKEAKDSPEDFEEEETVASFAPKGGVWIAGLAATLGLVFAGLWLARRSR